MIESINQTSPYNSRTYSAFNKDKNTEYYALNNPVSTEAINEKNKKDRSWFKIALIATGVGLGLFGLSKGLPKSVRNKINIHLKKIEEKISNSKGVDKAESTRLRLLQHAKNFMQNTKAINNSVPLKDVLVKKGIIEKAPFLKRFANGITKTFEKFSLRTVNRSYQKTSKKFTKMYGELENINRQILGNKPSEKVTINGIKKTKEQWVNELNSRIDNVKKGYENGFGEASRMSRHQETKESLKGLDDKVWNKMYGDIKGFFNNKEYMTFISEELAAPAKMQLNSKIAKRKNIITHDLKDNYQETRKILNNIDSFITTSDEKVLKEFNNVEKLLSKYKKINGLTKASQHVELNRKVYNALDDLNRVISDSPQYNKQTVEKLEKYIDSMRSQLLSNQKGEIQEMLSIYKHILPDGEYAKLKNVVSEPVKSLKKSINMESNSLFDKLRDLEVGSAPTDVLGLLSPAAIIGFTLGKADNKEERLSASLKYGIPALGAVGTTIACTVGLISGGPALAIGLASGVLINKVGTTLDGFIKEQRELKQMNKVV